MKLDKEKSVYGTDRSMNHAEEIWKTLVRATVDKKHPWRIAGFCTTGLEGPQARSVVLRSVDIRKFELVFYTDRRSAKMGDLRHNSRVALLFWNPRSNTQLRLWGVAAEETSELIVNSHWTRIPEHARKDYATLTAPGTPLSNPDEDLYNINSAKANFAVLKVGIESMEWLQLSRQGHLRMKMSRTAHNHWEATELTP